MTQLFPIQFDANTFPKLQINRCNVICTILIDQDVITHILM